MRNEALKGDSLKSDSLKSDASGGRVMTNEIAEKLGAYVDGELAPAEREAIETLVEQDRSCREIVQSFRFLDEAARRETVPSVSAGEWARIWEAIQLQKERSLASSEPTSGDRRAQGAKILHGRWLFGLAAAAAVIALVFVGFQMMQPSDTGNRIVRTQPSSPETAETPSPEDGLDNAEQDEDGEGIAVIDVLDGDAPDEISEDGVIYRDF